MAQTDEFYVPFDRNCGCETARDLQKEKDYLLGFLKSVTGKLNNERFMAKRQARNYRG
jgi:valyl-tRNA synthetase